MGHISLLLDYYLFLSLTFGLLFLEKSTVRAIFFPGVIAFFRVASSIMFRMCYEFNSILRFGFTQNEGTHGTRRKKIVVFVPFLGDRCVSLVCSFKKGFKCNTSPHSDSTFKT